MDFHCQAVGFHPGGCGNKYTRKRLMKTNNTRSLQEHRRRNWAGGRGPWSPTFGSRGGGNVNWTHPFLLNLCVFAPPRTPKLDDSPACPSMKIPFVPTALLSTNFLHSMKETTYIGSKKWHPGWQHRALKKETTPAQQNT